MIMFMFSRVVGSGARRSDGSADACPKRRARSPTGSEMASTSHDLRGPTRTTTDGACWAQACTN